MNDTPHHNMSFDDWDEHIRPAPAETDFDRVVERAISRRGFLGGVLVFGSAAAAMGSGLLSTTATRAAESRFPFKPIPIATDHTVHVPEGYSWNILARWGDPIFPGAPELDHATGGTPDALSRAFGDNTDGMEMFNIEGHAVIAVNHEYTNREPLLPQSEGKVTSAEDVLKEQNTQGVAVIEVAEGENGWEIVKDSPFNRRITHNTPMVFTGPAAGHALLQTAADPEGMNPLGTLNNCGSGKTPWGTYLTCEENFNGYFGSTDADFALPEDYARYGIGHEGWGYDYHKYDARFDVSKTPAEPRRAGWVVEIDPADPGSTPKKHTALGRFKHENAEVVLARDGRVVVYMGDDERGEFLYRYVSNGVYVPGGNTDTLLSGGTLYVARFDDDGTGEWLPLTPHTTGMDKAEICIFARMAASKVGATTMDRPEWVAANPVATEVYCALTNNKNRGVKANAGGDPQPVGGPNPRAENRYGQIVRWRPEGGDHAADSFTWDLYVMAGNPEVHVDAYGGSPNINEGNMFNSPDAVRFDSSGLLWIQTDGNDSNEGDFAGMGNNQMLVGDPATGRIERFLTGPVGSEVTGLVWSPDRRAMFVGIQHPDAPFPDGEGKLPRSAVIVVTRDDGGLVG